MLHDNERGIWDSLSSAWNSHDIGYVILLNALQAELAQLVQLHASLERSATITSRNTGHSDSGILDFS